jgi:hypothetical protein
MDCLGSDMRIGQINTEIISPERMVYLVFRALLTAVILIALLAILRYIARSPGDRRRDRHHDVQAQGVERRNLWSIRACARGERRPSGHVLIRS